MTFAPIYDLYQNGPSDRRDEIRPTAGRPPPRPRGGRAGGDFQIFKSIKMRRGPTPGGVGCRILIDLKIWRAGTVVIFNAVSNIESL